MSGKIEKPVAELLRSMGIVIMDMADVYTDENGVAWLVEPGKFPLIIEVRPINPLGEKYD